MTVGDRLLPTRRGGPAVLLPRSIAGGFALGAPGYTTRDVNDWLDGQQLSAERLVPRSSALPRAALTGRVAVPVFVIQGRGLHHANHLAKAFVVGVEAPRKAFVAIRGGHFAAFMNPSDFLKELTVLLAIAAR